MSAPSLSAPPRARVKRRSPLSPRPITLSAAPADTPKPSEIPSTPDWRSFRAHLAAYEKLNRAPSFHSALRHDHPWAHRQQHVEKGTVLLAAPSHTWPSTFSHLSRAVILITDVNESAVTGLLLNRPTRYTVRQHRSVLARVGAVFADNVVHLGGDCSTGCLEVLHCVPSHVCKGACQVVPGLFRGGFNASRQLVTSGEYNAHSFRFFVAYSKWTWQSLEAEMQRGAWITASCSPQLLLTADTGALWSTIMSMIH